MTGLLWKAFEIIVYIMGGVARGTDQKTVIKIVYTMNTCETTHLRGTYSAEMATNVDTTVRRQPCHIR